MSAAAHCRTPPGCLFLRGILRASSDNVAVAATLRIPQNPEPDVAALEAKVTALQTALNTCKGVAKHWREVHRAVIAGIAAAVLALGFVLGLNAERIAGTASNVAQTFGLAGVPDADAAAAAYQAGDCSPARGGWRSRSPKRAMPAPKRSSGRSTSAAAA